MTRREFIDDITSFWELTDFCNENACYLCEDIVDSDSMGDWIWDDIRDWNGSWESLADTISDIAQGHEYYRRNGALEYEWLSRDDFTEYKDLVLNWADEHDAFDDDEESDEQDNCDDGYWYTDPITGETFVDVAYLF